MDTWEKEGKKASKHFIRINTVQFLGGNGENKKEGASQDAPIKEQQKTDSHHDLDEIPF
jgi:single-stranded DNA-binding protein